MRRLICVVTLLSSVLGLAACSGGGTMPATSSQSQAHARHVADGLHPII